MPRTRGSLHCPSLVLCTLSLSSSLRLSRSGEWYPLFTKLAFDSPFGLCVAFSLSSLPKDPLSSPAGWLTRPAPPHPGEPPQPGRACVTWVSPGFPSPGPRSLLRRRSLRFSDCFQAESQGSGSRGRGAREKGETEDTGQAAVTAQSPPPRGWGPHQAPECGAGGTAGSRSTSTEQWRRKEQKVSTWLTSR